MVLFLNIRFFKVELNALEGLVRLRYNYNHPNATQTHQSYSLKAGAPGRMNRAKDTLHLELQFFIFYFHF